jgi:hypothetical protein
MTDSKRHYVWYGRASSEGGPVLVADLDGYPEWTGTEEDWTDDARYRVHYYGPIVAKLPEELLPKGKDEWHQDVCVDGVEASRAYVRSLRAAAEAIEPSLTMREQRPMIPAEIMAKAKAALAAQGAKFVEPLPKGADAKAAMQDWLASWRDHIERGKDFYVGEQRVLHIDAKPDTDYARACDALEGDSAIVSYGTNGAAKGVVWELEGAGTARIALSKDGFLLMRSWLDEKGKHDRDARKCAASATEEEVGGEITFATGRLGIVWAPVAPKQLVVEGDPASALRAAADLLPPVQLNQAFILNVGTLARVRPGLYRFACGAHEEEGWRCRWIRFTALPS